jgi:hypothetical protein
MVILEWSIWTITLLVCASFLYGARADAKKNKHVHIAILIQIILLLLVVIVSLFWSWSKLHLLWLAPLCLILGWIIGFAIVPLPVIGDVLRNISLIFAHLFLLGTNWKLGGFPWELSTLRAIKARTQAEKYDSVEEFEAAIKKHENQLFGIYLFNEGIESLYSHDKGILETTAYHYKQTIERGEKAIAEAGLLLKEVKDAKKDIRALKNFEFPPILGPGLDEMTQRATLLVQVYEKIFPNRPREKPLTATENKLLMEEVANSL